MLNGLYTKFPKKQIIILKNADNGHRANIICSLLLHNSVFSIFSLISCVKYVLTIIQNKKIKKFYQSAGMSTVSTLSRIIFF